MTLNTPKSIIEIDSRGPRFGAAITSVVFLIVLATEYLPLLIWQTAVFAIGAFTGPTDTPYRDWETDRKSTRLNSSHRL